MPIRSLQSALQGGTLFPVFLSRRSSPGCLRPPSRLKDGATAWRPPLPAFGERRRTVCGIRDSVLVRPMTLLVLLPGAAPAGFIASRLLLDAHRLGLLLLAVAARAVAVAPAAG